MSMICVPTYSVPAAATRPRIVSISGSPAATSDPKASTRMPRVTGQEISSDFIIAVLLASLKSDHMPGAPVRLTSTPCPPAPASSLLRSSAARTMSFAFFAAPACTTAVRPSSEIVAPGRGGTTVVTAALERRIRSTFATEALNWGSRTVESCECTTTINP
jgi:hypothetical protein